MFLLPETPYWLIENGFAEKAKNSLIFFRSNTYDIATEFEEIQAHCIEKQNKDAKSWSYIFEKLCSVEFIKPFSCVGVVHSLNMVAGISTLFNYMPEFIIASGSKIDITIGLMVLGIVRLVLAIVTPCFAQKMNPRKAFIIGQGLISFNMLLIAIYYNCLYLYPESEYVKAVNLAPMILIIIQLGTRVVLVLPVLYSLLGESFPTEIRTFGVGITQSLENGSGGLVVKLYPYMKGLMEVHGLCYFYAGIGLLSTIWGYLTIIDNRSKSLVEIEKKMCSKTPLLK